MSDLLHLVEAASALTRLPVAPVNLPAAKRQRSPASSSSISPVPTFASPAKEALARNYMMAAHSVSDDDDFLSDSTVDSASSKVAALRENHLRALRAAAANAGVTPAVYRSEDPFPMRLHALLADPLVRDIVSWLPHGRSFAVHSPDAFAAQVLPRYFAPEGSNGPAATPAVLAKYPSFTRSLDRWGFRQISRGPDAGAFCHELFRRDEAESCRAMVFQKSRQLDDSLVSGISTKRIASPEKRPYSSTVTVSTAGGTSDESMPLKKRKSGRHGAAGVSDTGIPSFITHRNRKMPASSSSVAESDFTGSRHGSVCSNNAVPKLPARDTVTAKKAAVSAEVQAKETLARHFHEQHRAYALASLAENGRLALEAAKSKNAARTEEAAEEVMPSESTPLASHVDGRQTSPPMPGAVTTHSQVFAPTVSIPEDKRTIATPTAKATRSALYEAYLQALSSSTTSCP